MRDDFAVFIITHKRPNNQITLKTLQKGGYSGKLYFILDDEDPTIDEYKRLFGAENVKIFHKKNNFDIGDNLLGHKGVPVYARNNCFRIAKELGIRYFLQLDDDYPKIDFRYENGGKLKSMPVRNLDRLFSAMVDFLQISPIHCVAFGVAGDYIGGLKGKFSKGFYYNARNSFFCCTDKPFEFVGRFYEDITTPAYNNMHGKLFLTPLQVQVTLKDHEKNKGGATEQYKAVSQYWAMFYSVMFVPSALSIVQEKHGVNKRIKWDALAPKILHERWRKNE